MSWEQHDKLLKLGGQSVANGVILNGKHVGQYGVDGFACNETGEAALKAAQRAPGDAAAEQEAKAQKAPKAPKAPKAEEQVSSDPASGLAGL